MDIPRLQKTLEAAGFTVQWFPTAQAAKEALVARFAGKTIGMGGSVTLRDLGLYEALSQRGTVYWHWQQPAGDPGPGPPRPRSTSPASTPWPRPVSW